MGEPLVVHRGRYCCFDCKMVQFFSRVELSRTARVRCGGCGGLFLDPVMEPTVKGLADAAERLKGREKERRRRRPVDRADPRVAHYTDDE